MKGTEEIVLQYLHGGKYKETNNAKPITFTTFLEEPLVKTATFQFEKLLIVSSEVNPI